MPSNRDKSCEGYQSTGNSTCQSPSPFLQGRQGAGLHESAETESIPIRLVSHRFAPRGTVRVVLGCNL